MRLVFTQHDRWFTNEALHTSSVYSDQLCCYCARPVRPDAARLRTARTNDGEWWLVSADEDMSAPEWRQFQDQLDGTFAATPLPVGPECLRQHPAWRFAVAEPFAAGDVVEIRRAPGLPWESAHWRCRDAVRANWHHVTLICGDTEAVPSTRIRARGKRG